MKKSVKKHTLLFYSILLLLSLSNCKKGADIIPDDQAVKNQVNGNLSAALKSTAADSLVVSTLTKFKGPGCLTGSICTAPNGSVYITNNSSIFKISGGVISTYLSGLLSVGGLKAASNGVIYFTSFDTHRNFIGKVGANGKIDTLKLPAAIASTLTPADLAIAGDGTLYIADIGSHRILKVSPQGNTTVLAGGTYGIADGKGANAQIGLVTSMKLSVDGYLYLIDGNKEGDFEIGAGSLIRQIAPNGQVKTIYNAPDANKKITCFAIAKRDAKFNIAPVGNLFLFYTNYSFPMVTVTGTETTLAAYKPGFQNGLLSVAQFGLISGMSIHENNIYVVDAANNAIRRILKK